MMTEKLAERDAIAGTGIVPASTNGAAYTGTVDMSKYNRVQFIGLCGTLGGSGTVDAGLYQSNNSNGATNTSVAGTNIAQITVNNSTFRIEVRADQLTARYVLCKVTVGTLASIVGMVPLGTEARYHPVTDLGNQAVGP
jgi:hypothetical protein